MQIYLQKHIHTRNISRFYRLAVLPNVFKKWMPYREWGRIGQGGWIRFDRSRSERVGGSRDQWQATLIKFAQDFDVHPNQIKKWHNQFLKGATSIFGYMPKTELIHRVDVKKLYVKIGELALECNLFSGAI